MCVRSSARHIHRPPVLSGLGVPGLNVQDRWMFYVLFLIHSSAVALAATRLGQPLGVSAVSSDHRPLPALRVKPSCQEGRTAR
jgi:hypothetical protein